MSGKNFDWKKNGIFEEIAKNDKKHDFIEELF
jgi:hypothetical protein